MSHTFSTDAPLGTRTPAPLPDAFFNDLCSWYCSQPPDASARSAIWRGMETALYQPLRVLLEARNSVGLRAYLESLYLAPVVGGLDNPYPRPEQETGFRACWNDELLKTAVALGVLPQFHPGQGNALTLKHDSLICAVETVIGGELDHPGGGHVPGCFVGKRFIPIKLLEAVRLWWGVQMLIDDDQPCAILEVGAGCGFLAYAFTRYSSASYHIIDLPLVAVIQRFLLASVQSRTVCCGLEKPDFTFQLVLNQNSLPEFPADAAHEMISYVDAHTAPGALFFSVNHESMVDGQSRVFDLMQMRPRIEWRQVRRSPAWTWPGYIEEAWRKL